MKINLKHFFLLALIPCLFWQYKTTQIQYLWLQTPTEYDRQYHNINLYPNSLLRIGNQLENKKYFQIFFKSLDRFYYPLNFNLLLSSWRIYLLPFFVYGIFKITKRDLKTLALLLALPLFLVNLIGYNNQGMYAFYPLIFWLCSKCFSKN